MKQQPYVCRNLHSRTLQELVLRTCFSEVACILGIILCFELTGGGVSHALDWVPTDQEMQKYRKSWNPLSNGPIFISGVDIHPKGQFTFHPFLFSQISEKQFGNDLTTKSTSSPVHSYQIAPVVTMAYGLTSHLELNVGLSGSFWWANSSAQFNQGKGGAVDYGFRPGRYTGVLEIPADYSRSGWMASFHHNVQHDCVTDQSLGDRE